MKANLRDEDTVEVAMAPLIDCVFLLLIFFLVATTLKKIDEELPLSLSGAQSAPLVLEPAAPVVVSIDQEGGLYLDSILVNTSALQQGIRARSQGQTDLEVKLDAHEDVPFEKVMEILDLLRFEQLHDIAINTRRGKVSAK